MTDIEKQLLRDVLSSRNQRGAIEVAIHELVAEHTEIMRQTEHHPVNGMDDLVRRHDRVRQEAISAYVYEHLLGTLDKKAGL